MRIRLSFRSSFRVYEPVVQWDSPIQLLEFEGKLFHFGSEEDDTWHYHEVCQGDAFPLDSLPDPENEA